MKRGILLLILTIFFSLIINAGKKDRRSTNTCPILITKINNVIITTNNDGANDLGSFSVCNKTNNILFNSFIDANGSTSPFLRVYQEILSLNNVTVPFCNNCSAKIGDFAGATGTAALTNVSMPGALIMKFRAWIDANSNNAIDANECTSDAVVYTITVNDKLLTLGDCSKTDAACYGTNTGSVIAGTVTNAAGSVSYSWVNAANIVVGTTPTVNNLPAGTYTLTVKDDCATTMCQPVTIGPAFPLSAGDISMYPSTPVEGQKPYTIYLGYGPQCATLRAPIVSGGTVPYSY